MPKRIMAALLFLAACSSSSTITPPPSPPAPVVATPTPPKPLQPPPSALRVADNAKLTGTELGTMWTFENPPLGYWKEAYGFSPSAEWLDHVRLASVRYGEYCSASFVSANGLAMTNHHCARACVEANSRSGVDYVVHGFYAETRADEKVCPGLFLDQLVRVDDVTDQVRAGTKGTADTERAASQAATIEQLQNSCTRSSGLTCQVVSLYHGGEFQLYRYKRYTPVKLVFAPEAQAGFFGGDPDNFTYPRYDLDVSFVRAYENENAAARTPHYFAWRADGPQREELLFVTGNPGSTSRQIAVSRVMYEREFRHPFLIQFLRAQRDLLQQIAAQGPDAAQSVREDIFEIENSLKANEGEYAGLQDSLLLGKKIRWERELRSRIEADAGLRAQYGDVWDRLEDIQLRKLYLSPRLNLSNGQWLGSAHLTYATQLVRYLRAQPLPETERPADLQGANWLRTEQMLRAPAQTPPMINDALLLSHLQMTARWLPPSDTLRMAFLAAGETPEAAARRIAQSRILDPQFRSELLAGGLPAVEASQDPAIRIALAMLRGRDALQAQWNEVTAAETIQQERLAKAIFAAFGKNIPPDATFTLRISDGVVRGYPYNGTLAPAFTTYYGMFGRAAEFRNEMPFTIPARFAARKDAIDMATRLNFVSTNDITGGNSGSPVIDREARAVGVAFDGNIESLPNEFLYQNTTGRMVGVNAAGITEALKNIYRAQALLRELTGAMK